MAEKWQLRGCQRDRQSITKDWQLVRQDLIEGVTVTEVSNVVTAYGRLTELYRSEWDEAPAGQVFQSVLDAGAVSAWHAHRDTMDRLSVTRGRMLIVLYDSRPDSSTYGALNVFRYGEHRPALVSIPTKVWHGIKNIGGEPASLVNIVDLAYRYEDPDHYRVPVNSDEIPFDILNA